MLIFDIQVINLQYLVQERNRIRQYLPADRHRRNRHDRVGNLRTVRDCRPDGSGKYKGTLQERSFEIGAA